MKNFKLVISVFVSLLPSQAYSQAGVPVSDTGVSTAVSGVQTVLNTMNNNQGSASKAIVASINNSNKTLGNINQALANIYTSLAKGQAQITQLRRNAELYDPTMGAKPRPGCSVLEYAAAKRVGDQAHKQVVTTSRNLALVHNHRAKYQSVDEDSQTSTGRRYLNLKKAEKALVAEHGSQAASVYSAKGLPLNSGAASGEAPWTIMHTKMMNMVNPNPIYLDPEADSVDQSSGHALDNAMQLIHVDRQNLVSEVVSEYVADRTKVYDAGWIKNLISVSDKHDQLPMISDSVQADLETAVSRFDSLEILSTHRIKDPLWVLNTASVANDTGLAKDRNLMQAQQLALVHELLVESRRTNLLLGYIYAHRLEQSGPPEYTEHQ